MKMVVDLPDVFKPFRGDVRVYFRRPNGALGVVLVENSNPKQAIDRVRDDQGIPDYVSVLAEVER